MEFGILFYYSFIQKGYFGRQSEATVKYPNLLGIRLAEYIGLVIKNNEFEMIPSIMIIVFDPKNTNS